MQIPILQGVFTDSGPDIRRSYPVNLVPTILPNGVSNGYLRPAEGISPLTSPLVGFDRGGINWNGTCYRVVGELLYAIYEDGSTLIIGSVGLGGQCSFDYSFDYLAIASGGRLYYYDGGTLTQVTDPDLGTVVDFCWVDGYFFTTDGEFLVVTELSDPFQVNPLKYASSEADPDPVVAIVKIRNEVHVLNRNTIEVFDNIGGDFFPFNRIEGAQVQKGSVGTFSCCVFMDRLAFLGSGRNEAPAIYLAASGQTQKLSSEEIDELISDYTEAELSQVILETRKDKNHEFLYVHLPDRTVVFDGIASQQAGQQVWFTLTSSTAGFAKYRARNFVYCYDKWLCGDTERGQVGYLNDAIGSHWGDKVRWELSTPIVYNEGNGGIFHELELAALTGRTAFGVDAQIWTDYSTDGLSWSQPSYISVGKSGETRKRLVWRRQGFMRNFRMQRFQGTSDARISVARLEAQIEPLNG
jgi:frataxin-like iron-binding protein CyaY